MCRTQLQRLINKPTMAHQDDQTRLHGLDLQQVYDDAENDR